MIHLSDVKKFERCATFYWRHVHEPIYPKPFVYYNEDLIELVKRGCASQIALKESGAMQKRWRLRR